MGWQILNLTTASNTGRVSFSGRGSIYAEGTFGSGTLELHPIAKNADGTEAVSSGSLYDIDGTTVVSADVPSGHYELDLAGSTGADIDVYYNDQKDQVIDS